jgi:hypothetical protein
MARLARPGGTRPGKRLNSARVLAALGLRKTIHPRDAYVYAHPTALAFEAYAKANREVHGLDVLGPFETEAGFVEIVDLRSALRRLGAEPTDPALPDD